MQVERGLNMIISKGFKYGANVTIAMSFTWISGCHFVEDGHWTLAA